MKKERQDASFFTEKEFLAKLRKKIETRPLYRKIFIVILGIFVIGFSTIMGPAKILSTVKNPNIFDLIIAIIISFLFALENFVFFYKAFVTSRMVIKLPSEDNSDSGGNDWDGFLIIPGIMALFSLNLLLPTNIGRAIISLVAPFIFPFIEMLVILKKSDSSHKKLTTKQLVLRSQIIVGYEIGFVLLLMVTAAFINLAFILFLVKCFKETDTFFKIFLPISSFLAIPFVYFSSFKKRLSILRLFFKKKFTLTYFILNILFLYGIVIYNALLFLKIGLL